MNAKDEVLKKIVAELKSRGILIDVLETSGVNPLDWMIVKDNLSLFE